MKKWTLLFIKYAPALMVITCAVKILLWALHYTVLVHYINLFLSMILIIGFYITGQVFHFCWKHRSLCRTALWGYTFYLGFLIFNIDTCIIIPLAIFYIVLVSIMCFTYKGI